MLGMCELYNVLDSVYMVLSLMCSSEEKEKMERKNFMNDLMCNVMCFIYELIMDVASI